MDHNNPSDPSSYLQYPPVSDSCSSAEIPSDSSDRERKRNARFGQWRTPPQPFFPSSSGAVGTNAATSTAVVAKPALPAIPPGSEPDVSGLDLASLQEAYRRGMAAAAALSKHQMETGQIVLGNVDNVCNEEGINSSLSTAQSCPNFLLMPPQQLAAVSSATMTSLNVAQQQNTQQQYLPVPYAAPPPPPPPPAAAAVGTRAAVNPSSKNHVAPAAASSISATIPLSNTTAKVPPAVTRSISLPDITKGGASAGPVASSTDEEKRIKRLARNRASARLRRLRKKNLVESYEEQVTVLEQSLAKLQAHKWGDSESDHSALIDALSMERGQQPLTAENRREVIKQILEQQKDQVKNLMDVQMEGWMLRWLATQYQQQQQHGSLGNIGVEEKMLADELQNVLNLSPEQMEQLKQVCLRILIIFKFK
jgi:hypothetical protein